MGNGGAEVAILFKSKVLFDWGAWVAQLVKWTTLDFGSGHDLTVHGIEPYVGLCTVSTA